MKMIVKCFVVFILMTIFTGLTENAFAAAGMNYKDKAFNREFRLIPKTDEISVKFSSDMDESDFSNFARDYNLTEVHNAAWNHFVVYELKSGFDTKVIDVIKGDNRVVAVAYPGVDQDGFTKYYDPAEATVQFQQYLSEEACEKIITEIGATVIRKQWTPNYYTISVAQDKDVFATLEILNSYQDVWFCEPSIYGFDDLLWEPNDPDFDEQWHLYNTGQESGGCACPPYADHDINAKQAWDMTRGDRGVVIVVIDSGMDLDHPDLAGNLLGRGSEDWDFADAGDNVPEDEDGHGTSCCGLAAAVANNSAGVCGVAPRCWIMPLRVDLASGQNQNRADAINYARSRASDFDAMVISMSWRMSSGDFIAVETACNNAYDYNDVLLLAAAGNGDSLGIDRPASYSSVCGVAACSPCDQRKSSTSCDGEYWWGSNYGDNLDFAAPGVLMYTTSMGGGYTASFNGTSSACPTAAGIAALVRSANRDLTNAQARSILQSTADEVGGYTYSPKSVELGHGRLNAQRAVYRAMKSGTSIFNRLDANMEAIPNTYLFNLGNSNLGGYFGETYFGPLAQILEKSYRDSYNENYYPMNSWDAALFSPEEQMITCVFNQTTDSVQISFAASGNEFHLEAYDTLGNLVSQSSGVSGSGNNSYLNVTSASDNIGYVVMHNNGNHFVVDDVMFNKGTSVRAYMLPTTPNPQITIPANGGPFHFWGILENNSPSANTVDMKIYIVTPGGSLYNYASYQNIPLSAYQRMAIYSTVTVPSIAPTGMMGMRISYGYFDYPLQFVWGGYQFGFYKTASMDSGEEYGNITEWSISGFDKYFLSDVRDPLVLPDMGDDEGTLPTEFALTGNYPNPFNPATEINYQLPSSGNISLAIYNILGQKVAMLVDGHQEAGYHSITWDASHYSSGVYFARLSNGKNISTRKMMLVK